MSISNSMYCLGGKNKGLQDLSEIGVPVPDFLTISDIEVRTILTNEDVLRQFCDRLRCIFGKSKIAVRSSANIEDGEEQSYAGCFSSVLKVKITPTEIYKAVKQVYESTTNVKQFDVKMNIVFQRMIEPIIAGVCFTEAYNDKEEDVCAVSFVKGVADKLVSGKEIATNVILKKQKNKIVCSDFYLSGSLFRYVSFLNKLLPIIQLIMDKIYSNADIEWCVDKYGNPWIVQLRPITKKLYISTALQNCVVASTGIVEGKAFCIDSSLATGDLKKVIDDFPNGRILVSEYTDTLFMPAIKKSSAILTAEGDILSHSAIISRELGIPCLVGIKGLLKKIKTDDEIVINTHKNILTVNGINILDGIMDIDWTSVYDFSNIIEYKKNNNYFLFENIYGNYILYHKSNCDKQALSDAVRYFTNKFKHKLQLSDSNKYHWYFEWKNFKYLDCFCKYYAKAKIIAETLDVDCIHKFYDEIFIYSMGLKNKLKVSSKKNDLIYQEQIISLFFILDMLFPMGMCTTSSYQKAFQYLDSKQLFVELLTSNKKVNKHLEKIRNFMFHVSIEKNNIFKKFIDNNLLSYDYMQERDAVIRVMFDNKYPKYSETMYKLFYQKYIINNLKTIRTYS